MSFAFIAEQARSSYLIVARPIIRAAVPSSSCTATGRLRSDQLAAMILANEFENIRLRRCRRCRLVLDNLLRLYLLQHC